MKNVLIIGSSGYIGSRLCQELSKIHSVVGVDTTVIAGITQTMASDYRDLTREFIQWFDVIILLAGHSSVKMCEGNPMASFKNNVENFLTLLDKIDKSQCFIYASSSSVYGRIGKELATEESRCFYPYNNYDLTKNIIDQYATLSEKNYYGLRFGTVNGSSPITRDDIMINAMTKNSLREGKIKLFFGETNRPILDIQDLCSAIERIIERNDPSLSGIYNLCSFNSTSREIAERVSEITGSTIENFDDKNDTTLNRSVYDFSIDNSKFCDTFDWKPKGTTESIIRGILSDIENIRFVNRNEIYEYK
jgi:nucleoside-diphosphate-sugar epimerase